jgi:hypothetical protein
MFFRHYVKNWLMIPVGGLKAAAKNLSWLCHAVERRQQCP